MIASILQRSTAKPQIFIGRTFCAWMTISPKHFVFLHHHQIKTLLNLSQSYTPQQKSLSTCQPLWTYLLSVKFACGHIHKVLVSHGQDAACLPWLRLSLINTGVVSLQVSSCEHTPKHPSHYIPLCKQKQSSTEWNRLERKLLILKFCWLVLSFCYLLMCNSCEFLVSYYVIPDIMQMFQVE